MNEQVERLADDLLQIAQAAQRRANPHGIDSAVDDIKAALKLATKKINQIQHREEQKRAAAERAAIDRAAAERVDASPAAVEAHPLSKKLLKAIQTQHEHAHAVAERAAAYNATSSVMQVATQQLDAERAAVNGDC